MRSDSYLTGEIVHTAVVTPRASSLEREERLMESMRVALGEDRGAELSPAQMRPVVIADASDPNAVAAVELITKALTGRPMAACGTKPADSCGSSCGGCG